MTESSGKDVFKASHAASSGYAFEQISKLESEVAQDLRGDISKFKDPVVFGTLLYRTIRERESTNLLFKNIMAKLDAMEQRLGALENKASEPSAPQIQKSLQAPSPVLLADVDKDIVSFVKAKGHACAQDVQAHFAYRGKNAASARLNRLCELSLLEKQQVGRKVYFHIRS